MNMVENKVYGLRHKNMLFQPSKCAEGWAIYLDWLSLEEQTEQGEEFWKMLEQSVFNSTGSYKLFRQSLIKKVDKWYVDVAPRRPCNKKDKGGNRPESTHHTHVYYDGIMQSAECTCEGDFYPHFPDPDLKPVCPHAFANIIVQTMARMKPILPFDFHEFPEEIINVLLLNHKHSIESYLIDAYLFEKHGDKLLTPKYKELVDVGLFQKVTCNVKQLDNLVKMLEKDYNKN